MKKKNENLGEKWGSRYLGRSIEHDQREIECNACRDLGRGRGATLRETPKQFGDPKMSNSRGKGRLRKRRCCWV